MRNILRVFCAIVCVAGFATVASNDRQLASAGVALGCIFGFLFLLLFVKRAI